MATLIKEKIGVQVNILERSVTFTVNIVFQTVFKIIGGRGLQADYLIDSRKVIEDGLFAWLSEQTLISLHVEIFRPGQDSCIERWDFDFEYRAEMDENITPPPLQELEEIFGKLDALPAGSDYQFAVRLKSPHVRVRGWSPAPMKALGAPDEHRFSGWGYGAIGTSLTYRGRMKPDIERKD